MASTHDSSTGTTPIRDQRATPRGVLPRQLQMWLMVGLAVLILGIILITGRTTPAPRASAVARATEPSALPPERIQGYQRQLAEDEARLQRELAQAAQPTPGTPVPANIAPREAPPSDPIADEQRRREYQSLFADNVAFSHRPAEATSYSERTMTARPAVPLALSAMLSPQDLLLLQAIAAQRASSPTLPWAPAPGTPEPTTPAAHAPEPRLELRAREPQTSDAHTPEPHAPETRTPDARPAAADRPAVPKETGRIRSSDPRQRLTEGTVIETVLINRLNGTFAGPVECLVTTPVYSHDRQRIVIPAGARVLGSAAPVQAWGDTRLAVSFHRLLMPDGHTYSLDQFKGLDQVGATGLKDEVNRHYLQVFGASAAIGALSGLAQYGTTGGLGSSSFADEYRQTAGSSLAVSSGRVLDRYLNVLPTVTIREGFRIRVYLTSDLDLPAFEDAPGGIQ